MPGLDSDTVDTSDAAPKEGTREEFRKRLGALRTERTTWWTHWRELMDYEAPRGARFMLTDTNKGVKRNQNIVNSTPLIAVRTLQSGMMAGLTSPARPWFRLITQDPDLAEVGAVRSWLELVEERMRMVFARSNAYRGLHQLYGQIGVFGTGASLVDEDVHNVIRLYPSPTGQFMLANSERLKVDTFYREFRLTAAQLVAKFGAKNCSTRVNDMVRNSQRDAWVDVVHAVEPRRVVESGKIGPKGMPWRSVWFEASADIDTQFLRDSGYQEFPVLTPRWETTGEDVYGRSPGMDALGDCKAIQLVERRAAQGLDKIINPPMRAPISLQNRRASLLPGDITYLAENGNGQTFEPAITLPPAVLEAAEQKIGVLERRIQQAFYADLWLMLSNSVMDGEDPRKTATEVNELHEEKMLQLGPVVEQLGDDLLDPLIDRTFNVMLRRGMVPPPPRELQGQELRVEYLGILAQAQKMLGTSAIERLVQFAGSVAQIGKPEVLDKLNTDEMVDEYGGMLGVKPDMIVPQDKVEQVRAQRAKQQQQAQQAQMAMAAAKGAKDLASTDMSTDNGLTRLVGNLGPLAGAAASPGGVQ